MCAQAASISKPFLREALTLAQLSYACAEAGSKVGWMIVFRHSPMLEVCALIVNTLIVNTLIVTSGRPGMPLACRY